MPKFEDRFVHFRWDESLKDKRCFVADNIPDLNDNFIDGNRETVIDCFNRIFPFQTKCDNFRFAYYDPNYDVKVAYEEGKQIQYKAKNTRRWCDWDDSLSKCIFVDNVEFRVKPESDAYVVLAQSDGKSSSLIFIDEGVENRHVYFHGSSNECHDYIESHNKFASIMQAWENGEQIQFKNYDKWLDVAGEPEWIGDNTYRVKPEEPKLKWTDLSVGDIIERIGGPTRKAMVTEIDGGSEENDMHVYAGCMWFTDEYLKDWRKVKYEI